METVTTELQPRQCTATNREGERCRRAPIPGGSVCPFHGGRAPQTMAAARARLNALVEPVLDHLLSMLEQRPPCPTCGRSDADRDPVVLRACQLVLDRAGFHPTVSVQNERPHSPADSRWFDYLTPEKLAQVYQVLEWRDEAMRLAAAGAPLPSVTVVVPATAELTEGALVDEAVVDEADAWEDAESAKLNAQVGVTIPGQDD